MFGYYLELALRGLRRNVPLTVLMIAAIGAGVGASVTALTALRALSADPIPSKSSQLFNVRIDNWGPHTPNNVESRDEVDYPDAMALLRAQRAARQSPMYAVTFSVTPKTGDAAPFTVMGRATTSDFFQMFAAPIAAGAPWSKADDAAGANVVVIGAKLAARLYPQGDAVGQIVTLSDQPYRIVGILKTWHFQPRVYDLSSHLFQETEDVFLPLTAAVNRHLWSIGGVSCIQPLSPAWDSRLASECRWLQYWVELPDAAAVRNYRDGLVAYSQEQRHLGRFRWQPDVELLDVNQTLRAANLTPSGMRVSTIAAFGFLLVCLVNATGLMLAKLTGRVAEFSVRRALGASKAQIFMQCLADAALVGAGGGVLGVVLTVLGLAFERALLREDYARLIAVDVSGVIDALGLALLAMAVAAVYPAWSASRLQPAWKLRSE
jgi:putative ABC transport system permease protein